MIRHWGLACLSVSLGLAVACEQGSNVEAETRDLAEAQKNTGNVAKDLEGQLQKAKAEVVELEKKLALAREGITDDVLEERKELQNALDSQRRELQEDISQAQREAQALNKDADRAIQQLQQTQPPAHVDAQLKTETDVVPGSQTVESTTKDEVVPVRGVDAPTPPDPVPSDPAPSAPAPSDPAPIDPPPADAPPPDPRNLAPSTSTTPAAPSPSPSPDEAAPPPPPPVTHPAPIAPVPTP